MDKPLNQPRASIVPLISHPTRRSLPGALCCLAQQSRQCCAVKWLPQLGVALVVAAPVADGQVLLVTTATFA